MIDMRLDGCVADEEFGRDFGVAGGTAGLQPSHLAHAGNRPYSELCDYHTCCSLEHGLLPQKQAYLRPASPAAGCGCCLDGAHSASLADDKAEVENTKQLVFFTSAFVFLASQNERLCH